MTEQRHTSYYLHPRTRAMLDRLKKQTGARSNSILIRAALAVLAAMPKATVVEWLDDVKSWRNGK